MRYFQILTIAFMMLSFNSGYSTEYFNSPTAEILGSYYFMYANSDIDQDGDMDIIAYSAYDYIVTFSNDGNGHFSAPDSFSAPDNAWSIYLVDLNGDDYQDIVLPCSNGWSFSVIAVYINDGNGSFMPGQYSAPPWAHSAASFDYDGDGDQDLAVALGSSYICVFENNGDGTFQNYVLHNIGRTTNAIISFDTDNDNDRDLAIINSEQNSISVITNTGDGTINAPLVYTTGSYPRMPVAARLNGDAYMDIAVASPDGNITLLINDGDGTFDNDNYPMDNNMFGGYDVSSMCSSDLDNDGSDELIVSTMIIGILPYTGDAIHVLYNNGDGTFQQPVSFSLVEDPWMVLSADFDGDNDMDISALGNNIVIMRNHGDGTFVYPEKYYTGQWPFSIVSADFDQDNDTDIATANRGDDNVSILLNNGEGIFFKPLFLNALIRPSSLVSSDFDLDGMADLAVANSGIEYISILSPLNRNSIRATPWSIHLDLAPRKVYTADFDGNGFDDLATVNRALNSQDYNFSIIFNRGGDFSRPQYYTTSSRTSALFPADFDNDNSIDLAVVDETELSIMLNDHGLFVLDTSYTVGAYPTALTATDFDGDGYMDLAVAKHSGNSVKIFLNDGSGKFEQPEDYFDVGYTADAITHFDLDEDDDMDLAVASFHYNLVSVLINNGDGTFQNAINYAVGGHPISLNAADYDNNGMTDLGVAIMGDNCVLVLKNQLDPILSPKTSGATVRSSFIETGSFPNPFNSRTTIEYAMAETGKVKISIYNILGRKVETLIQGEQPAGYHQVMWDAEGVSSGIYFYRIQAGDYTDTRKMLLIK